MHWGVSSRGRYSLSLSNSIDSNNIIIVLVVYVSIGVPKVISTAVDYEVGGLVCTSTGGPATTVTWSMNDQLLIIDGTTYRQSQRVISTVNATFENILHMANDNIINYVAKFECLVRNSRGNDSESFNPEGIFRYIHAILPSLLICSKLCYASYSHTDNPWKYDCW